jgi:acetyl-CoA carboxylase biotin carboxyl carrier protein
MTEEAELLERVRNAVVGLVTGLPRAPERLRVRARHVVMELDWAEAPRVTAEPVPATTAEAPGSYVTAPAAGTVYRSPEPGAAPFVRVGDQVCSGQQVAIVEAMKVMLPVEADTDGVVTEVLVDDGQPVEYGHALFVLARD